MSTKNDSEATRSTIMDINAFRPEMMDALPPRTRALVEKRNLLGPSYRLFYRNPIHIIKGRGAHVWDGDGRDFLDVYNNVVSVGHCHPRVVEAVCEQVHTLNTHSRYLHETILDYAQDLLSTMPDEVDRIMFQCTGSEANDLALRVAKAYTGGEGIIVTEEAYHGNTDLTSRVSPALGTAQPLARDMRMIPTPDTYRLGMEGADDLGCFMVDRLHEQIADMNRHGITFAAFLADSIFSSDGVFPGTAGWMKPLIDAVHEAGGVFIADEVQPGFTRTGNAFWGFARHGVVPDLITTGKPMANGMPCSAMAARHEVLEPFSSSIPYFNTFGGNPVSMAAAQAVLDIMREENTLAHAKEVGDAFRGALEDIARTHPCIGDVRGTGLYIGCEIVEPGTTNPDAHAALDIIEGLREHAILTSVCGFSGNVLKLRPPLVFDMNDLDRFMDGFATTLDEQGL